MAFPSTLYGSLVIALNGNDGPDWYQAGGTLYPGYVVQEDDADEVKACLPAQKPIGVVGSDASHPPGVAYSAGDRVPVWLLGCGVDLYVLCKDPTTITLVKGAIMDSADSTTLAGYARVKDSFSVQTTTFNYAYCTERNLSSAFWIGRCLETGSITSAVARYVPVRLSL